MAGERGFAAKKSERRGGDCIYAFCGGYADQFGGPAGMKFMRKQFLQLLPEVNALPMSEQLARVQQRFDEWRGEQEQVDDVLVIGVRV